MRSTTSAVGPGVTRVAPRTREQSPGTRAGRGESQRLHLHSGDSDQELPPILAFEGTVDLPGRVLAVSSVYGDAYIERASPNAAIGVQVWVNDDHEPDDIAPAAPARTPGYARQHGQRAY